MIFLFTECEMPDVFGPFANYEGAAKHGAFGCPGVAAWYEEHTAEGWVYELRVNNHGKDVVLSHGIRPIPPVRPWEIEDVSDEIPI